MNQNFANDAAADRTCIDEVGANNRFYTICIFKRGLIVPEVELMQALSDGDAVAAARSVEPSTRLEVWDQHRLVAAIAPQRRH